MLTSVSRRDEPSTDRSLLIRARRGDEIGWQRLVHIYGPLVYRWMRSCGVQSADAADLMQETLLAVANRLDRFDTDRDGASFRGWLWTIARNNLRDRQRRRADEWLAPPDDLLFQRFATEASSEPPTDAPSDRALVRMRTLQSIKSQFAPRAWRMFWRTEIDGADAADVADELGVSKWAVYKAKSRVLHALRRELAGLDP